MNKPAITRDGGKIPANNFINPAQSTGPSGILIGKKTDFATMNDDGKIAAHDSLFPAQSVDPSVISTVKKMTGEIAQFHPIAKFLASYKPIFNCWANILECINLLYIIFLVHA